MKRLYIYILFLSVCFSAGATAQMGDVLICGKDTFTLFSNPLRLHPQYKNIIEQMFWRKSVSGSTACWRGYVAEWRLEKNKLYLSGIAVSFDPKQSDSAALAEVVSYDRMRRKKTKVPPLNRSRFFDVGMIYINIEQIFPGQMTKYGVFASWVNDTLVVPKGKCVYYIHDGYASVYEKETDLFIENGRLTGSRDFDNSRTRTSPLLKRGDVSDFIGKNIRWDSIPFLSDKGCRIVVGFSTGGESGKVENIRILRSSGEEWFDREAIRVVSLIPGEVIYRRGTYRSMYWTVPVIFSEKTRNKYCQKK